MKLHPPAKEQTEDMKRILNFNLASSLFLKNLRKHRIENKSENKKVKIRKTLKDLKSQLKKS